MMVPSARATKMTRGRDYVRPDFESAQEQGDQSRFQWSKPSQPTEQDHMDNMAESPHDRPLTPSPLFTKLTMTMCRSLDFKYKAFLPQDQLEALTPTSVKEELKRAMPTLSNSTLDNYTAKILVLLNRVDTIASFISGGFTDSLLPIDHALFSSQYASRHYSDSLLSLLRRCFNNWIMSSIKTFLETQWIVLSPFLSIAAKDVSLFDFDAQVVLPIFNFGSIAAHSFKVGGYSIVQRVKIHSWHHDFGNGQDEPSFALKKLHSPHIQDFRREVATLRRFVVSPNLHIIKLLAAFRHGASFYLLFPWAEGGNLRSFWKENPNPLPDKPLLRWITEQCHGIATALRQIHYGYNAEAPSTRDANDPTRSSHYGLHGDIKPANILLFKDGAHSENLIWVLSDFGLGGLHLKTETYIGDRPIGFSPTYRAPELDLNGTIDSAYDVWSLGCVFLEIAVWLLRGWDGLGSFALSRANAGKRVNKARWIDDRFFELVPSQTQVKPNAKLRPSVVQWINTLVEDQAASPYIADFLDLIHVNLLDTNCETRASSSFLVEKLQCLRQRCSEDPTYTVALPRPRKPPWHDQELTSSYTNDLPALNYQTHPIHVNMAQIPIMNDLNYTDPMPITSPDGYWPDLNQQFFNMNNNTMLFNVPIEGDVPTETISNSTQFTTRPNQYVLASDQALSVQHRFGDSHGRRRRLDEVTGPNEMGDERKKKARKKGDLAAEDFQRDKSPLIANQDQFHVTTNEVPAPADATEKEMLFACPFHKRNPKRYSTKAWKSCIASGWNTISRLKEHIYRKHYLLSYRCDRCLTEFKDRSDLHSHSRSEPPCAKRDSDVDFDTIDETQKAQIQKKWRGKSEEQKWSEIYRIIFKLDSSADIPSPYCDILSRGGDAAADSIAEFETYLRHLANNNKGCDVSAIRSCLDLVHRFRHEQTEEQSLSISSLPSLTYDHLEDAGGTSQSRDPPSASGDDSLAVPNAEGLNDLSYCGSSFDEHFNKVFSSEKPYGFSLPFDLGSDGGMLSSG
ncbi:hypothetical protein F4804DRAFT_320795 [Jackrogersella minutella]|nr:hypothetical protein F4804DRAFT_320795 [Jackrogersella minutella]